MPDNIPELPWYPLRSDLSLIPHGRGSDGAPIYTIHDPVSHKFYRISWREFEILYRWGLQDPQKMIRDIHHKTTIQVHEDDIQDMQLFLHKHQLLSLPALDLRMMHAQHQESQKKTLSWLIKNYLFFRIRLIRPDRFLKAITPKTNWLFTRGFILSILCLALIGIYLILREWASFKTGLSIIQTPTGMVMTFFALCIAKTLHEFGHGISCRHYGCHVPNMGVAFIVMWPILWTDTTDAWRLKSPRKRLVIDSAGMIAELSLAAISSILWALSPDGSSFKVAMQLLAGTTWVMTLFVNLNPFMRFDGYYITSDLFNFPNLQERSFKLARQYLRLFLWGIVPKFDHNYSQKQAFWLCAYAFGTWIYRFFLFLGIALMVYHLFFKSLGMLLMVIELYWFIVKPISHEIKEWPKLVKMMPDKKRTYYSFAIMTVLFMMTLLPLQRQVTLPAIIKASTETPLLVSHSGQIKIKDLHPQQDIKMGDVLFTIHAPELEQKIKQTAAQYSQLALEYKQQATTKEYYQFAQNKAQEMAKTHAALTELRHQKAQLTYTAPHDGAFYDIPDHITHNSWVTEREFIGLLGSHTTKITAYVTEQDVNRLAMGAQASFHFKSHNFPATQAHIIDISQTAMHNLEDAELATMFGGAIQATETANGAYEPAEAIYKITLSLNTENTTLPARYLGYIVVEATAQSVLHQFTRKAVSIFRREFGAW